MTTVRQRPRVELLAPAGNFEKLEMAIHFGADAVYLGGKQFSLRGHCGNFAPDELEAAIAYCHHHDAMCMAYSGRCLLSSFLARRDGNRELCAQPCRWQYALVEEKRPGGYMPVQETDQE